MNLPPPVPTTRDAIHSPVLVAAMQSVVQGEIGNFVVLEQNAYSVRPVLGTPWYSTRIRAMAHRDLDICEVVEIVEPDLDISKEKR